jgi:hypothetical protein
MFSDFLKSYYSLKFEIKH